MKKLPIFLCLLILSCSKDRETIFVQYDTSSGVELLSSSVFEDAEILVLHGDGAPILGWISSLVVKNDKYYIAAGDKIHQYDATGNYLNSVGEKGRGPGEYVDLLNMIVEENGNISVYSWGTLLTTRIPVLDLTTHSNRSKTPRIDNHYLTVEEA